ncbi:MAG: metallophosphoesterase family protein [Bacillota bacterium]
MSIKFIHTADLHLGSSLHTDNEDILKSRKGKNPVLTSFHKLIDTAINKKVDFVLIAGDLFDSEERSVRAVKEFNKGAKKLDNHNIDIYMIAGNHDPINENNFFKIVENVYIFGSEKVEIKEYEMDNQLKARIIGQSYRSSSDSREMYKNYILPDDNILNIALLHTQLDRQNNNYVPGNLNDLLKINNIDYWALGHIHKNKILKKNKPLVIYPGTPQGRDFGESGLKGFYLIEFNSKADYKIDFIPSSKYIWKEVNFTISEKENLKTFNELRNFIKENAVKILMSNAVTRREKVFTKNSLLTYIIRWKIKVKGLSDDNFNEDKRELENYLSEELRNEFINNNFTEENMAFWTEDIRLDFDTNIPVKKELIKYDNIFKQILSVKESLVNDKVMQNELKETLGDIWQGSEDKENIDEFRFSFRKEMNDIINEAEKKLLIDLWKKRGE